MGKCEVLVTRRGDYMSSSCGKPVRSLSGDGIPMCGLHLYHDKKQLKAAVAAYRQEEFANERREKIKDFAEEIGISATILHQGGSVRPSRVVIDFSDLEKLLAMKSDADELKQIKQKLQAS